MLIVVFNLCKLCSVNEQLHKSIYIADIGKFKLQFDLNSDCGHFGIRFAH